MSEETTCCVEGCENNVRGDAEPAEYQTCTVHEGWAECTNTGPVGDCDDNGCTTMTPADGGRCERHKLRLRYRYGPESGGRCTLRGIEGVIEALGVDLQEAAGCDGSGEPWAVEPVWITDEELDALPEHDGW